MSACALAAGRPHYGGTLRLSTPVQAAPDPARIDTYAAAVRSALSSSGLCRYAPWGSEPVLADAIESDPLRLTLHLREGLTVGQATPLSALEVAASWARLFNESASPYRALFAPIQGGEAGVRSAAGRGQLTLSLAYPWPDLAGSLCHPALAVTAPTGVKRREGLGPFNPELRARLDVPGGRPYLDRIVLATPESRAVSKDELALDQGSPGGLPGPALEASYLLLRPSGALSGLRALAEAVIDRNDLVRYFVPAPAAPMRALLPPELAPGADAQVALPPATSIPGGALSLGYDEGNPVQRAVAERLALKLSDRGVMVKLTPLSHDALWSRWASGDFDLLLATVLLPPQPGPALAVALELAGAHELLRAELPPIGALASPADRQARVVARAAALTPSVQAVPLFAQGARYTAGGNLAGLLLDSQGVPDLLDVSLAAPEAP